MPLSRSPRAWWRGRSRKDVGCSVRPWAFLHLSASFLACGSPGEPFEECASPRTVLPLFFPPLAPAKHCPRALPCARPSLVLPEGGLQPLCCSGLCFWSQGVASAPIGAGGAEGGVGAGEGGGRRKQISMSHKGHKRSDSCNCPRIKRLLQCWLP